MPRIPWTHSSHATDPEASSPLVPAETQQTVPQLCLCGIKHESQFEHFCLTAAQTVFVLHVLLWVAIMMSLGRLRLLMQLEFIHVGRYLRQMAGNRVMSWRPV